MTREKGESQHLGEENFENEHQLRCEFRFDFNQKIALICQRELQVLSSGSQGRKGVRIQRQHLNKGNLKFRTQIFRFELSVWLNNQFC